ncbi:MAG: 50S ribosomal protein L25 [Actinobacteria bacterium]|nr:MAG: 50S ribosomal protein L25 [Actinomycetota bacterium]
MARATSTKLSVSPRQAHGSRAVRRLRREGRVPGVLYGRGGDSVAFEIDARELRLALAATGAVLDVSIDGGDATPAVLKDAQRDPVHGQTVHVDLQRVRLDQPIHAVVTVELTGAEEAPGAKEGGVLEHVTRELNVEALPTEIPESISYDVSAMDINDTVTLAALTAPPGVTLLDDLEETVIATLTPPKLQLEEEEEPEEETELVGEGEEVEEGEAPPAAEGEAERGEGAEPPPEGGGE